MDMKEKLGCRRWKAGVFFCVCYALTIYTLRLRKCHWGSSLPASFLYTSGSEPQLLYSPLSPAPRLWPVPHSGPEEAMLDRRQLVASQGSQIRAVFAKQIPSEALNTPFNSFSCFYINTGDTKGEINVCRIRCNCLTAWIKYDTPKQCSSIFIGKAKETTFLFSKSLRGEMLFSHMNLSFELWFLNLE